MRVAVFGVGGVGGYFGGRLAQAGEEVFFIARGEHLAAIQQNGLHIESPKGSFNLPKAQGVSVKDLPAIGRVDIVLIGVKAWQVTEAAQAIEPLVGEGTAVVPLQNGVDAPGQLAAVLESKPGQRGRHVLGGLCRISSSVAGPGRILHNGIEPYIAFNELAPGGVLTQQVDALRQAFEHAGVLVETPADIQAALWGKFLFITAVSGVGSVTRSSVGVFRSLPETRQMLTRAINECAAVGRSHGVHLLDDAEARTLATIDGLPEQTTASMQRDIAAGRPSELDAQNGAVVRLGRETGVPTPVHEFIYASLLPQERQARNNS